MGFYVDPPKEMTALLASLDRTAKGIPQAISKAMGKGGEAIAAKQKALISGSHPGLANMINPGPVYVTKKGQVQCGVGYSSAAIKEHPETVILEFGRPGQSGKAQAKGGFTTRKPKKGKEHRMKIGVIEAVPHIRRGFEEAADEAAQLVLDGLCEELDL